MFQGQVTYIGNNIYGENGVAGIGPLRINAVF